MHHVNKVDMNDFKIKDSVTEEVCHIHRNSGGEETRLRRKSSKIPSEADVFVG